MPLSVERVIDDRPSKLQPKPKGPLPDPESYFRLSCGPKPERPGLDASGTLRDPVPVTGLTANFSPIPRTAPPPLGRDTDGSGLSESTDVGCSEERMPLGTTRPEAAAAEVELKLAAEPEMSTA